MKKFIKGITSFLSTVAAWWLIGVTLLSAVLVPTTIVVGCGWLLFKMFGG